MTPLPVRAGTADPVGQPRTTHSSPRNLARLAGVFQLLEALTAAFGQVIVVDRMVVYSSAATTAANILGHAQLYWLGLASSLIGILCHVTWGLLMFELFRPVSRRISGLAAFVILVGCAVQALTSILYLGPLLVLRSAVPASAFSTAQLQSLALLCFRLYSYAYDIYLVFFGTWCVLIGWLIFRSGFMPRVLGVLVAFSGAGWMLFLAPPFARHLFIPYIAGASAIGEVPLLIWCLVVGVREQRGSGSDGTGMAPARR